MMNRTIKSSFFVRPSSSSSSFRSISLFHSSPILERKRRTHWNNGKGSHRAKRFNYYARMNKMESKRTLLRDISDYADHLFQSWRDEDDFKGFPSNDDTAWFRRRYWAKGAKINGFGSNESQWGRYKNKRNIGFNFCASDDDVETIFRSAFRRGEFEYWSFDSSENFRWRNPSGHANRSSSWDWRYETEEEVDSSPESELASERRALGLNASGPLKIEDVKTAYRACALSWHPDRHQGSSKAVAEEKFKLCSAAYKSLCEKLAIQ